MLWLHKLKGWKNDLSDIPPVNAHHASQYLVKACVIDSKQSRAYKLCRPYKMMEFVHSVSCHEGVGRFSFLQGQVNPSQSTSRDDVKLCFVVLDKEEGTPYGGCCVCTAGQSGACAHVGALLFVAADIVSSGMNNLPDELSCTEKPCAWVQQKAPEITPVLLKDIKISSSSRSQLRHDSEQWSAFSSSSEEYQWKDAVTSMYSNLVKEDVPPVGLLYLHLDRFDKPGRYRQPQVTATLPDRAMDFHPGLAHCYEVEVETALPLQTVPNITHEHLSSTKDPEYRRVFDDYLSRIAETCTADMRNTVEVQTRGQWRNVAWYAHKVGCIGASKLLALKRVLKGGKSETAVLDTMGNYKDPIIPAVNRVTAKRNARLYGLYNEDVAKNKYSEQMKSLHKNFEYHDTGLVIHEDVPYLRVSPDGIATCDCHAKRAVEIKCPWILREGLSINEAVQSRKMPYLKFDENNTLQLTQCNKVGYFEQVQSVMAATKSETCDFIIWTPTEFEIVSVHSDQTFFEEEIVPIVCTFFESYVMPELITECLKKKISCASSQSEKEKLYLCFYCSSHLKEESTITSVKDNSVGCDCSKCSCDNWAHWKCARYTDKKNKENVQWICHDCTEHH